MSNDHHAGLHAEAGREAPRGSDDTQGLTFGDIFAALRGRRTTLLAATVLAGAIGYGGSFLLTPVFTAKTLFLPPQQPQGGFNCTLNYTASHATYPLKCMLTPNVRGNAGCYRAFTVKAPEGSVLNCDKPMAVNLRTRTG